ncbi:hypothetical protein [Nesterenkonia pannonica]|uniref:nucleoside-diphosphate sugar epimerase/dehydratase n=1 Tax=Nesterenkonia pannonica TaxID=1548602 RepID=UPI0021648660|nr:hypothetical protein [Nesterenkonia pannonica]
MGALSAVASRNRRIIGSGAVEYRRVAQATFAVFGLLAIIAFAAQWQISRGYLILALPLGLGLLLITRWLWRRRLTVHSAAGLWDRRAVLAGEPTKVSHALEQIRRARPGAGLTVIDTDTQCTVASILDAVTASGADTVLLTSADALDPRTMRELGWELSALDVDVIAAHSLTDVGGPRLHSLPVAGLSLVQVDYPRLSGSAALTKRTFDIGFSLLALCALMPVLAVIAWAVRRDTPEAPSFGRNVWGSSTHASPC